MKNIYNPPPNWPKPPQGWTPSADWRPDPAWGPLPKGWRLWIDKDEKARIDSAKTTLPSGSGYGIETPLQENWFVRHKVITVEGGLIVFGTFINAIAPEDEEPPAAIAEATTPAAPSSTEPTPDTGASAQEDQDQAAETVPVEPSAAPLPGYGPYPPEQQAFIEAFEQGKERYDEAETELQRSLALTDRDTQMCSVSGNGNMVNWSGKIVEIGANNDGLAHVTIEIAPNVKLQTWNNALSDIGDDTLIPQSAPFFNTLAGMSEGTLVSFSAQSVPSEVSCLEPTNLTEVFTAVDPNYLVRFSDVRPQ